jgi:hypothetical protein
MRYWPVRLNSGREISLLKGRACAYPELDTQDPENAVEVAKQVEGWLATHRDDPRSEDVQQWLDVFEDQYPWVSTKMQDRQKRKTAVEVARKHSQKRS